MRNDLLIFFVLVVVSAAGQVTTNITFSHEGKTVYGSITVPPGPGPFPAIVIVPGSGAMDRDGTISMFGGNVQCLYPGLNGTTLRPYKQLGDALAKAGYAVLRYNKLEYNYTTPAALGTITFKKLWLPFESAIEYVRKRPDVDSTKLILIGHSEGSTLIPFVTKSRFDIQALVSLAGARTPFDSILGRQIIDITQLCGGDMQQAQAQANAIYAYFNDIRSGTWNSSTPPLFGVPASVWSDYVQATDPVTQNYGLCYRPTLFLGMGDDFNVPPSELTRFQNEISIPADFWTVPDVNHYLTYSNTPTVAEAVPDTIIFWLSKLHLVTGIGTQPSDEEITVSPNPATDKMMVTFPRISAAITIVDITGRPVYYSAVLSGRSELNVEDLKPGIYFIRCEQQGRTIVNKFIKS